MKRKNSFKGTFAKFYIKDAYFQIRQLSSLEANKAVEIQNKRYMLCL